MDLARRAAARAVIEIGEAARELEEPRHLIDPPRRHISTVVNELARHRLERIGAVTRAELLDEIGADIQNLSRGRTEPWVLASPLWNSDAAAWWSEFWQVQRKAMPEFIPASRSGQSGMTGAYRGKRSVSTFRTTGQMSSSTSDWHWAARPGGLDRSWR
jgi:hypothetical protein